MAARGFNLQVASHCNHIPTSWKHVLTKTSFQYIEYDMTSSSPQYQSRLKDILAGRGSGVGDYVLSMELGTEAISSRAVDI